MKKIRSMVILPSYAGGGAERVLLDFLSNSISKQVNNKLFVVDAKGPLKNHFLKKQLEFKYSRFIYAVPRLVIEIRKNKIDVLISTFPNISTIILLLKKIKIHNCKIIIRQPNMIENSLSKSFKLIILKFFYKKLLHITDALIVTSEGMKKESLYNHIKEEKIYLLRNPVNISSIRRNRIPTRNNFKGINLVFVGRLVFQKGLDRILFTIKKINNIKLTIIGEGSEKKKLQSIIKNIGIEKKVEFLGYIEKPFDRIAGSDYFILPSRWEGLPNCVLESLSLGTPVIAFSEIIALKDYKKNISERSIIIVNGEKSLYDELNKLEVRKDYLKPKLRKNLLYKYTSPKEYQQKFNKLVSNVTK